MKKKERINLESTLVNITPKDRKRQSKSIARYAQSQNTFGSPSSGTLRQSNQRVDTLQITRSPGSGRNTIAPATAVPHTSPIQITDRSSGGPYSTQPDSSENTLEPSARYSLDRDSTQTLSRPASTSASRSLGSATGAAHSGSSPTLFNRDFEREPAMPPMPSQKGTGKKGRDIRQSRSRNTTPSLAGPVLEADLGDTAYLDLPISAFRTSDEIVDNYGSGIPSSRDLEALLERLKRLSDIVDIRSAQCDKGMRMVAQLRKERLEDIEVERREEERNERLKKEAADEEERGRNKASKLKKKKDLKDERQIALGAHGVAPQDGSNLSDQSSPIRETVVRKPARRHSDMDSASSSLSPVAPTPAAAGIELDGKNEDDSSSDEQQSKPARAVPHLQTFGSDPSTFPDPTIYEIREVTPGMDDDLKREIYSVAHFPPRTLEDLIPGSPPDKDFSNAKPTNQVQANTFATYIEPFFRPFTEEDLAFLRERGDRTTPFLIPRRGKKHYTEVWAEEDGAMSIDSPQQGREKFPANQARGGIGSLDDSVAETDQVSAGPLLSRLLATMRPEHRAPPSEDRAAANGLLNGDSGISSENKDLDDLLPQPEVVAPIQPATYMVDSNSEGWKKATHPKLDHAQVDERIKQELRHIGFLPPDTEPDYDAHYDDEIAARLRYLQSNLKEQSIMNGARKARLTDLTKERMAHQEYSTILEDLDSQVQTSYLKRTRTMGKSKKAKRPGGAGGGSHFVGGVNTGMARPGIGDATKTLMERRRKWIDSIGLVFDSEFKVPRLDNPQKEDTSIFKPGHMADFVAKEKEAWEEDGEEE